MPRVLRTDVIFVALLGAAGCGPVAGGSTDGKMLFGAICARCHGADGRGDPLAKAQLGVPDMTDPVWQDEHSDDDIVLTVHQGSKSRKMPGFGSAFTEPQLRALITHVRSLRR